MKGIITTIIITAIVTGLIVWGLVTNLTPEKNAAELEIQLQTLQDENQTLADLFDVLQEENQNLVQQLSVLPEENQILNDNIDIIAVNRYPLPGWEQYFPSYDTTTLTGSSITDIGQLLGEPPYKVRSVAANSEFNREIWIFMSADEDPTGLYLFFKGDTLYRSQLNEFHGLYGSGLLDDDGILELINFFRDEKLGLFNMF